MKEIVKPTCSASFSGRLKTENRATEPMTELSYECSGCEFVTPMMM